jgi:hypothetical protein
MLPVELSTQPGALRLILESWRLTLEI